MCKRCGQPLEVATALGIVPIDVSIWDKVDGDGPYLCHRSCVLRAAEVQRVGLPLEQEKAAALAAVENILRGG